MSQSNRAFNAIGSIPVVADGMESRMSMPAAMKSGDQVADGTT